MDKYLNIKNSCEIVYGNNGSVIYDFDTLIKYNIFDLETKILYDFQNGISLDLISNKYATELLNNFIDSLIETNIGYISNSFIPSEPYRMGNLRISAAQKKYHLDTIYIELPTSCNENCSYCNIPKINGCYSCSVSELTKNTDTEFYTQLFAELNSYNCSNFILHGGNPLNDWTFTKKIIDNLLLQKTTDSSIFIITNDNIIDNKILDYISFNNINLIININYIYDYPIDMLTDKFSIFSKYNINFILNFNVNYLYIKNFKKIYSDLINKFTNISYSIYSFEKDFKINYSSDLPNNPINLDIFNALDYIHPCLSGTLSIKSDKKVYPCIGFNNNSILDLSTMSLDSILFENNTLLDLWNTSSSNLESCSDCKFKKCCSDCRAFEISNYNNSNSKSSCILI